MSQFYHAMLSPIVDVVKSSVEITPFGDHSYFLKLAKTEAEAQLSEVLDATDSKESFEKASELVSLVFDGLSLFVREAKNQTWKQYSREARIAKVKALQELPQIPQRSEEWFRQFGKILTASEFSAIFVTTKRKRDLVYSKANVSQEIITFRHACPTNDLNAIGWGIRFEPVVKQILEYKEKWKIYESGRIHHPTNTHLAASPDGIIEDAPCASDIGKLVEIKCPYSRAIGYEIPVDYWIQMQIQMEVTGLDECEYVECDILSKRPNQTGPLDLSGTTYQGNLYLLKQIVAEGEPFEYKYLYGEIGSHEMPPIPDGFACVETIPWGLKSWHRKVVQRDRPWYEATKGWQAAFWQDVESVRQGETLQQSQKLTKPTACLITDD